MPLASLDKENCSKYIHSPAHDLESLLHTALGIVTFTAGPCGQIRAPTDHVPLARWYNETDREQLRKDKTIDLISYERRFTTTSQITGSPSLLTFVVLSTLHGLI